MVNQEFRKPKEIGYAFEKRQRFLRECYTCRYCPEEGECMNPWGSGIKYAIEKGLRHCPGLTE